MHWIDLRVTIWIQKKHTYIFITVYANTFQQYCVQQNSYLAHIEDWKQNAFLKELFSLQSKSCAKVFWYMCWLG